MTDWTPDETAALLRGETVVRWVEMCTTWEVEVAGQRSTVDGRKYVTFRRLSDGSLLPEYPSLHRVGDRVEVHSGTHHGGCPRVQVWDGGDEARCTCYLLITAICTAVEPERREVPHGRMFDDRYHTPTRWGWREEWRRDDD